MAQVDDGKDNNLNNTKRFSALWMLEELPESHRLLLTVTKCVCVCGEGGEGACISVSVSGGGRGLLWLLSFQVKDAFQNNALIFKF